MTKSPAAKTENIVVQKAGNEILIYNLTNNKAFCLNETTAMIWEMCDGTNSASKISRVVENQLKTTFGDELVWLALNQLKKEDLIDNGDDLPDKFGVLGRREVLKKIGFASMVALPIISSLIAPSALHAQSNCGAAGCTAPGSVGASLGTAFPAITSCNSACASFCAANTTACCSCSVISFCFIDTELPPTAPRVFCDCVCN